MADVPPQELTRLLSPRDRQEEAAAWEAFVAAYHRLLLHVAREAGEGYDDTMDAYADLLEQLRRDDCRRLRAYTADQRCAFTTWLVVVARRLCIDRRRRLYGRSTREHSGVAEREARRRLMKLVTEELDLEAIADPEGATPLSSLETGEREEAITSALAELDEKDRVLLALRFEDGLSVERIAVLMRMPSSFHVYRQLNRIFDVLRARLRAHRQSSTSSSAEPAARQKKRSKPFNQG